MSEPRRSTPVPEIGGGSGAAPGRHNARLADVPPVDWRKPERRRECFHDFYEFHLRYGASPGGVYALMPWLRERYGWDDEQALWFAFLNGNTQNPVTSLLLHAQGSRPDDADAVVAYWQANYSRLAWDADRRYHKKSLARAIFSYLPLVEKDGQAAFWGSAARSGFSGMWYYATGIDSFGRLSAFSYLEYLRIMGVDFDCDDLMLGDMAGSRSHRNGLCIVTGLDHMDWHKSNPDFDGHYDRSVLSYLEAEAASLLSEARARAAGQPWERDVSYFTLESTLCTYKGWHRPNRRYAGVYWDMHYNRIVDAERAFDGDAAATELILSHYEARRDLLPEFLRIEDNAYDPGLHPLKQNHYRETGEVVVLGHEFPRYWSAFDEAVHDGSLPGAPFR